jgi:acyl carrier protein phosphodiesterase
MNYLAHAYLSFDEPEIVVGNMISDFVKGKQKFSYSKRILDGIDLHRAIDNFTDDHPVTKKAKDIFRPHYRLYSGAFVDVVYDHFLANDVAIFPGDSLFNFSVKIYKTLENHSTVLPAGFQTIFPYMKTHNWLYNYRTEDGISKSFGGLVRRAKYLTESATAFDIFINNYAALRSCYESFFPLLKTFAENKLRGEI